MSLEKARADLAEFNLTFKARMEAQRKIESAELQAAVDREVYALFDLGWSVSKIAKEYGTSDWATVKKILDRRVMAPKAQSAEQPSVTREDNGRYKVFDGTETVVFDLDEGLPWFYAGANTHLAQSIRNQDDVEEYLQSVANTQA